MCQVQNLVDPSDGLNVDVVSFNLAHDCGTGTWALNLGASATFTASTFDFTFVYLDTDMNAGTGDFGADYAVLAFFDDNDLFNLVVLRTPTLEVGHVVGDRHPRLRPEPEPPEPALASQRDRVAGAVPVVRRVLDPGRPGHRRVPEHRLRHDDHAVATTRTGPGAAREVRARRRPRGSWTPGPEAPPASPSPVPPSATPWPVSGRCRPTPSPWL